MPVFLGQEVQRQKTSPCQRALLDGDEDRRRRDRVVQELTC